jgi:hypothetical protein
LTGIFITVVVVDRARSLVFRHCLDVGLGFSRIEHLLRTRASSFQPAEIDTPVFLHGFFRCEDFFGAARLSSLLAKLTP